MIKQRTIKDTVTIEGIGLQTGARAVLRLKSSPANSGINFIRTDLPDRPLLNLQSFDLAGKDARRAPERRTTLTGGALQIQTTEHFLAALSGLGVDNIVAELDGAELPGMDGSAKDFVEALKKASVVEQDAPRKVFKVERPIWCREDGRMAAILPDETFRISYTMSYENVALGTQYYDITVDEKSFENEIAPARTFCLKSEALVLAASGLGKGSGWKNTLIMGRSGPFMNKLRFKDEPVRHKILDLIGDLYLLGAPIKGHVIAIKSGHKINLELVRKIKELGNQPWEIKNTI